MIGNYLEVLFKIFRFWLVLGTEKTVAIFFRNIKLVQVYFENFLKAYYGFQKLHAFPFPSAGHVPLGLGRNKVGLRAYG